MKPIMPQVFIFWPFMGGKKRNVWCANGSKWEMPRESIVTQNARDDRLQLLGKDRQVHKLIPSEWELTEKKNLFVVFPSHIIKGKIGLVSKLGAKNCFCYPKTVRFLRRWNLSLWGWHSKPSQEMYQTRADCFASHRIPLRALLMRETGVPQAVTYSMRPNSSVTTKQWLQ